jgi:predicted P-loop ATPase/GTPase
MKTSELKKDYLYKYKNNLVYIINVTGYIKGITYYENSQHKWTVPCSDTNYDFIEIGKKDENLEYFL